MATPKKRTGKASQATRRANWKGTVPATTICPNCKEVTLTHTVCHACGWYKDGFASIKKQPQETVEEVKVEEPKKTRKPRAKKAEETEEKVVEAEVVEAKAEETEENA